MGMENRVKDRFPLTWNGGEAEGMKNGDPLKAD
jgi:hypothetical protein